MSAISLYQAAVPPMLKGLRNLVVILQKAEKFCDENNVPREKMLTTRLIHDMRPLTYQVQSVSDTCKAVIARVGGAQPVSMTDDEQTFEDLYERVRRTVDLLEAVDPASMEVALRSQVVWDSRMGTLYFTAEDYVLKYALPNFHFHLTTAYCIVRFLGVPVSAFDYLDGDRNLFRKEPLS